MANIFAALALAFALLQAPCGFADGLPWYVEDGFGNPRPCPSEQPPAPPPPYPEQRYLPLVANEGPAG